jgi:hypothetical protein
MGIEPMSEAWEASILPLYDARLVPFDCTRTRRVRTTASSTRRKLWHDACLAAAARAHEKGTPAKQPADLAEFLINFLLPSSR